MKLILLGPPGAGKGTQATVLLKEYGLLHISTGAMLRDAVKNGTQAGAEAQEHMNKGDLVPDAVVTKIVVDRISQEDAKNGFMLDGFPRTMPQGEELDKQLTELSMKLDIVLYFNTPEEVTITRLTGRRVCPQCGFNYHITNIPPKVEGICDECDVPLIQREDDKEETIKNRLKIYEQQTSPLLDFYKEKGLLREVRGDHDVNQLFEELKELFKEEGLI